MANKKLIQQLDTEFSIFIRRRYAINDIATCVTCGKQDHWKKLQAGHFMSRKHLSTRWDEDNVQVQCAGCNIFRAGEQFLFSKHLGLKLSEKLLIKSKQIVKFTDVEINEMIDYYKQKNSEF